MSGVELRLLSNYLSDRVQYVKYLGAISKYGVSDVHMDIGAKSYLDSIKKYQHLMHLKTRLVAPLFFSPYVVVADNKTILDFIIRRQDSQSADILTRQAEKNLPRAREWQRHLPINPKIGSFVAYNIDIPKSDFALGIPSPLELVQLIRKIPNRQSPSSLVHSEEICSYEHEFTCINPLQPPGSLVPANDLIPPPAQFEDAPSVCPSPSRHHHPLHQRHQHQHRHQHQL